ncbi:DJ-1/PfpI family protein [uncultured Bdellovibrio sp.]|uniref:DJ-1/PfpI family protein n=1 Tax=Bdellovibrio sp. HCB-162 TaxID=3394234 RepID=UPI0025F2692C|nr:DJ-1/PfpI family protein [uncultured Bdellovibrio sp.]
MKIGIVVVDGFSDIDFYLPWDLLNRVRILGLANNWTVEVLANKTLHSATKLPLQPTQPYFHAKECDGVFFCSGNILKDLCNDPDFLSQFDLNPSKQYIAAVDSGTLILAALGHLNDKDATTYPTHFEKLKEMGTHPIKKSFVSEGRIATGARCLSSDKLSFWLIESLLGPDAALKVYQSVKPLDLEDQF